MNLHRKTDKRQQRREFLAARRSLTAEQRSQYSTTIINQVLKDKYYQQAEYCFLYASMPDEVHTDRLLTEALKAGKHVCLPYILDKSTGTMVATEITSLDDLCPGEYGIFTVPPTRLHPISPNKLDFILVPGVSFNLQGYRLGMGAGYYDRFLAQTPQAYLAAAIYNCQLATTLAIEPHDAQVHKLYTETQVITCK